MPKKGEGIEYGSGTTTIEEVRTLIPSALSQVYDLKMREGRVAAFKLLLLDAKRAFTSSAPFASALRFCKEEYKGELERALKEAREEGQEEGGNDGSQENDLTYQLPYSVEGEIGDVFREECQKYTDKYYAELGKTAPKIKKQVLGSMPNTTDEDQGFVVLISRYGTRTGSLPFKKSFSAFLNAGKRPLLEEAIRFRNFEGKQGPRIMPGGTKTDAFRGWLDYDRASFPCLLTGQNTGDKVAIFVDDGIIGGERSGVIYDWTKSAYSLKDPIKLEKHGDHGELIGVQLELGTGLEGRIGIGIACEEKIEEMEPWGVEQKGKLDEPLNEREQNKLRSVRQKVAWIAIRGRPDVRFALQNLVEGNVKGHNLRSAKQANRIIRHLKMTKRGRWFIPTLCGKKIALVMSDASANQRKFFDAVCTQFGFAKRDCVIEEDTLERATPLGSYLFAPVEEDQWNLVEDLLRGYRSDNSIRIAAQVLSVNVCKTRRTNAGGGQSSPGRLFHTRSQQAGAQQRILSTSRRRPRDFSRQARSAA